ncbi:MAG: 50S ribosomal protein L34 [Proteobacteria bacterium]|nr:50S ribosomal protein L34 [Pseudomonadota bacterium]
MPKRTYKPSKRRRARTHGFLARKLSGGSILIRRRLKKRSRLTPA